MSIGESPFKGLEQHFGGASFEEKLKSLGNPAFSMAVMNDCRPVLTFTAGECSEIRAEADGETIFQAASISKPVFAAAVMRLAQVGGVDLDADVSEYLEDYSLPRCPYKNEKVTLRRLLTHTAGFNLHGFAGYEQGKPIPDTVQILKGAKPSNNKPLKFISKPGQRHIYSGGGYLLAQKAVCDYFFRDYEDLISYLVFKPAGMEHSTCAGVLGEEMLKNAAFGRDPKGKYLKGGYNIMTEPSADGLWSTPSDLLNFGSAVIHSLDGQSDFLSPESARLMTEPYRKGCPCGVGFLSFPTSKGLWFGHTGDNIGYHSIMLFHQTGGRGFAAMIASDRREDILRRTYDAVCDLFGWPSAYEK